MQKTNPNCDGQRCKINKGEVRILPAGGDSNIILCRHCFEYEMKWRYERNKELSYACRFDIPKWESLKIYEVE